MEYDLEYKKCIHCIQMRDDSRAGCLDFSVFRYKIIDKSTELW